MSRKKMLIVGIIVILAVIAITVSLNPKEKKDIKTEQQELNQLKEIEIQSNTNSNVYANIIVRNTSSSLSFDTTNISISATLLGARTSIDTYIKPYYIQKLNNIKFGFNISVPSGVTGNNFVNRLQTLSFEVNSTYDLEATKTGFRYKTGQTKIDQFTTTDDYIVYDFSDILNNFYYRFNYIDEDGINTTINKSVDYTITISKNKASIDFDMTQIKFSAGQTINLDPSVSISNVATYTPQTSTNITTEAYPLSHITMNDSSLIGYYPFDVNYTSGNIFYDYSASNNDGTAVILASNFQWNTSGYITGSISLNNNPSPNNAAIDLTKPVIGDNATWAVSLWFLTNISSDPVLYGEGNTLSSSNINSTIARLSSSKVSCSSTGISPTTNVSIITSNNVTINDKQWHHLVCVQYSITNITVFLDGVSVGSNNSGTGRTMFVGTASIGKIKRSGNDKQFTGNIDEVMIWNRSLSTDEITALYNMQYGRYATAPRTQVFSNVSLGQDGTIDLVNITTNTTQLNGTSMQLRLWEYNSTGSNTQNTSWFSITTGTNKITNFTVLTTTYNVSLEFNFSSNAFSGYSPILHDSINVTSWSSIIMGCSITCGSKCLYVPSGCFNYTTTFELI